MENASKALIIAGAILLAILLISLGIMIFNQAQDTVNNSGMSQAEISAFNNKFLKYESESQKGSVVKSLMNEVISSNAEQSTTSDGRVVQVTLGGADITSKTATILTNKTYTVKLEYKNGVVNKINLTEK